MSPQTALKRTRLPKSTRMRMAINNVAYIEAEKCRRSLLYFVQTFWPTVSNDEFKHNWHIDILCDELSQLAERVSQGLPKKHDLIINVPPGTTKTIICSIMFPVWCWVRWFWMRFITASYSAALSLESAEYSRDIIRSEKFRKLFPALEIKQDKDTKSNFRVQKREYYSMPPKLGGNRFSTSVGGTLTGFHGHILIVDDPINPNQSVSKVELTNANRWIDQTLSTRKVDKAVTPTILIMQRLCQDDPTAHLLSKHKANIKHISLPGEIRDYRDKLKPKSLVKYYKDDLLDPVRMNWDVLKELREDLGEYGYASQIGQSPIPPSGGMFHVDRLTTIERLTSPANLVGQVRAWDKAATHDGGAYTVGLKLHKYSDRRFLVVDVVRGQWSSEEREAIILNTARADGGDVPIVIEQEPGSGGKESAEATIRNLAGFSVTPDRPTGDKVYRADPVSVQVNAGNFSLLRADWNGSFIDELKNFPYGTYKDQVDALSMAFHYLVAKKQVRVLFSRRRSA